MKDIGQALLVKTDEITESWIDNIRQDWDIESARGLAYQAVRNSIPHVIEALASLVSQFIKDEPRQLENKGLEHGVVRAEQGYDVTEVVREYGILRRVIITVLKPDLLSKSGDEILQMIDLIDEIIDKVISLSLESYIETRLRELEQIRNQLLLTNQELTRLVSTQKEDLSYLAHELKTPLNSIMGFSSLLLQQQQQVSLEDDTSLSLQLTEKVINNSKQLLRLINDVLEISRYEAGKMQLNLKLVDAKSIVQMVADALELSAKEKNLEMILNCDRAPQQVQSDPLKLRQIVTNLVNNAISYTESGTVTITCQMDNDNQWSLIVADTGIGMTPEAQAQVFEPYYRVGSGSQSSNSPDGTGLGLAIVDKLATLLQGKIEVVSKLAEGSTFTITFPMTLE
ncbi:MAG: sensor histidine kinase [Cyanobacteria bacterium P01_G01_bin.49]